MSFIVLGSYGPIMLRFPFLLLDTFFIYISNVIPFPGFPSKKPLYPLSPPLGHNPTHSCFLALAFPYTGP